MSPEKGISFGHDLQKIAGAALREKDAGAVVRSLSEFFDTHIDVDTPVSINTEMYGAWEQIRSLSSFVPQFKPNDSGGGTINMAASIPYETTESDGLIFESRVFRLTQTSPNNQKTNAYFIGVTTEGAESDPTLDNLRYGVLQVANRENIFFEVKRNPNLGKFAVQDSYVDPETERILVERRFTDRNRFAVMTLDTMSQEGVVAELNNFIEHKPMVTSQLQLFSL